MDSKIKGSFWTDDAIGELDPNLKLVAAWVMTNPNVTCLGTTRVSARNFTFHTGLPVEKLEALCKALPRAFTYREGVVVAHNFIAHQCGTGEKLRSNNIFRSILGLYDQIREPWLKDLLASFCPEIRAGSKPYPTPFKGKGESNGGSESDGNSGSNSGSEDLEKITRADVEFLEWAKKWPGEAATGAPPMPAEWAAEFVARMRGRIHMPASLQAAAVASWRREFATYKPGAAVSKKYAPADRDEGEPPPPTIKTKVTLAMLKGEE